MGQKVAGAEGRTREFRCQADRLAWYQCPCFNDPSSDGEGIETESDDQIVVVEITTTEGVF